MANAVREKRMVYRVKSSTTEDGKRVYSVLSCADDVEHRRHRKNPFDIKYVQAVLSTFETVSLRATSQSASHENIGEINNHGSISRFEVEVASTNVHVRMELIKTMKENLAKTTSDAVKHYKGGWRKKDQKNGAKDVWEERPENSDARTNYDLEGERGSFFCHDIYKSYRTKFGSHFEISQEKCMKYGNFTSKKGRESVLCQQSILPLDLHTAVHVLETHAKDNPNFLQDENLCFNLDKEATETLEIFKRFEPTEASMLEINLKGEVDISSFCKHIKTVIKDLDLDANISDAEEDYQDSSLIPQADQQSTFISFSEKGSKNMFACRVESIVSSDYVLDSNLHFDDAFTPNAREQCKFMGEFTEKELDNHRPCKYSGNEELLNISFGRTPLVGFEVQTIGSDHHCRSSVFEHSGFPEQIEKQKISQGLGQGDNTYWINQEAKISEDVDSIEEFLDDATESSTLEVNRSAVSKTEYNRFTESSTMVETVDSNRVYLLGIEDSFQYGQLQENHPSASFGIYLSSKELVKFRNAKLKQSRKKVQWSVQDMEKLLDSTEQFDSNSDMECIPPSVFQNILVGPEMFLTSLSRPLLNLVEHCEQLEGSPLKIPGALHFSPTGGDYEYFDLAELDEDAIDDRSCCSKDSGEVIDHQNQSKLPIEDSLKHSCVSRKLCHEDCMLGVNWDDIIWSCEAISSKNGMKAELSVPMDVDSVSGKDNMLRGSKSIPEISECRSRESDDCCVSKKHDIRTSHIKSSEKYVFAQMCDVDSCLIQVILPVNSGGEMILEELADHLNKSSEGCLGVKGLVTDFGGQQTNHSKDTAGIHIASESTDHSKEQSADQCDTLPVVKDIENIERIHSSEVQRWNEDFFGMLQASDSCKLTRMENEISDQDHSVQKQRKRYHLDDLIADVVMAECQFHQQAMCHFDLAPLSSSLATSISAFYHNESISSVNFEQLLKALKGMIDHENGVITMQRYYMALLSLAHQQNVGTLKGPFVGGYQIHLQVSTSCSIKDILISMDPIPTK